MINLDSVGYLMIILYNVLQIYKDYFLYNN